MEQHSLIENFDGYTISSYGYVMKGRKKMKHDTRGGYIKIINNQGERINTTIPELLAKAYVANPNGYKKIRFKDGNKNNWNIENLFWADYLCDGCQSTIKDDFYETTYHRCKKCIKNKYNSMDEEKKNKYLEQCKMWQKENTIQYRLLTARNRAKKKGISFNLTEEYILQLLQDQNHKCYYSGRDINESTLSIDRVDSSIGYEPDNIVLCDSEINYFKNGFTIDEFFGMIKSVYEYKVQNEFIKK